MIQVGKIKSLILIQGKILFEDPLDEIGPAEYDGVPLPVHGNCSDRPCLYKLSPGIFCVIVVYQPIAISVNNEHIGIDLFPIDQGFQLVLMYQFLFRRHHKCWREQVFDDGRGHWIRDPVGFLAARHYRGR